MIKQCIRTGLLAVLFITVCFSTVPSAHAVESFGVGARPANPRTDNPRTQSIFVYDTPANTTLSDAVIVANSTETTKVVKIYSVDSQSSSDGAFACAQEADEKKAVGSWINLEQSEITLEPGKSAKVPFTLTVPSNVDVGEHDGCIAVQAADAVSPRDQNGISLSFRSALRVAVTVPGDLKSELSATSLQHTVVNDKLIITPSFKNTGNVSVDAQLTTQINSLFGQPIEKIEGTFLVLRDAQGTFNFEGRRPFWGGYYTLSTSASYKPLSASENSRTTNQLSQTIFIPPQPLAMLIETVAILGIAGAAVFFILRRKHHNERVKFSKHHTIKQGEDVQSIGNNYDVSWKLVARVNKLKAPYTLKPGEKLLIPGTRKVRKTK